MRGFGWSAFSMYCWFPCAGKETDTIIHENVNIVKNEFLTQQKRYDCINDIFCFVYGKVLKIPVVIVPNSYFDKNRIKNTLKGSLFCIKIGGS